MRRLLWILIPLALVLAGVAIKWSASERTVGHDAVTWQVYFSPNGGCTQAIVDQLAGAEKTVRVQAYSFTSAPIAKALTEAKKRGVDVQVVLDKGQRTDKYSGATFLHNAGIPTFIDEDHAIAHNKVMVIDGRTVITGSFNFSRAAEERNAENLLILHSAELAARYTANWELHRQHSVPYTREDSASPTPSPTPPPADTPATAGSFIGNTRSLVFHRPTCLSPPAPHNRTAFQTRQEAVSAGYRPCGQCRP